MTEITEIEAQDLGSPESKADEVNVASDDAQKPVFNQRQMQDAITRERKKAFEKGRNEALMELQDQQQMQQPVQQSQPMQQPQISRDDIEQLIAQKTPEILAQQVAQVRNQQVIDSFVSKMQAAEQKHPGLEQKLNNLDYRDPGILNLIQMANNLEGTGEIMKELVDNPMKMGSMLNLFNSQPWAAQQAMTSLANSIKQNQDAEAEETQARNPLGQVKPSTKAGVSSGELSVKDLRRMLGNRR